jgi:threonine/homoserine/homoserine lactone efflux protein
MIQQLIAFTLASLLIIIVPGPDMALLLRNAARGGQRVARHTVIGIMTGNVILGTAAAFGLTILLMASTTLYHVVRIAGGLYLVWLGIQSIRSVWLQRHGAAIEGAVTHERKEIATHHGFREGLLSNLLNPKVAIFYLSLFPQFNLNPLSPLIQHVVLAGCFCLLAAAWYVLVLAILGRIEQLLRKQAFSQTLGLVTGSVLVGLGGWVLARR